MEMEKPTVISLKQSEEPTSFGELEEYINRHFLIVDEGIVRLLCAVVTAHKFKGDPVWLFIVSASSSGKTELLNSLARIEWIYQLSSFTPQTLLSGQRLTIGEASLLHKIEGQIVIFKDFTTVLELNVNAKAEILSQLREVYDGRYAKSFGTGEEKVWEGKLGFIAGVTGVVDLHQGMYNILGERFLQYRMKQPNRIEATLKGLSHTDSILEIRETMKAMFKSYVESLEIPSSPVHPSKTIEMEIAKLSEFATRARTGVLRERDKNRDIDNVFDPEMPIRFAKQLKLIWSAFQVMGSRASDMDLIAKLALSSLPQKRIDVLRTLAIDRRTVKLEGKDNFDNDEDDEVFDSEEFWTTTSVAIHLNKPNTTVRRVLEDLTALGVVDRKKSGSAKNSPNLWFLKKEYKDIFANYYLGNYPVLEQPDKTEEAEESVHTAEGVFSADSIVID